MNLCLALILVLVNKRDSRQLYKLCNVSNNSGKKSKCLEEMINYLRPEKTTNENVSDGPNVKQCLESIVEPEGKRAGNLFGILSHEWHTLAH